MSKTFQQSLKDNTKIRKMVMEACVVHAVKPVRVQIEADGDLHRLSVTGNLRFGNHYAEYALYFNVIGAEIKNVQYSMPMFDLSATIPQVRGKFDRKTKMYDLDYREAGVKINAASTALITHAETMLRAARCSVEHNNRIQDVLFFVSNKLTDWNAK